MANEFKHFSTKSDSGLIYTSSTQYNPIDFRVVTTDLYQV